MSSFPETYNGRADLGGGCRGCTPPPPEMTCDFLIKLVFCRKKNMWFIGVKVEQEKSAPPPQKNPGSAPEITVYIKPIANLAGLAVLITCLLKEKSIGMAYTKTYWPTN